MDFFGGAELVWYCTAYPFRINYINRCFVFSSSLVVS